MGGHGCGQGDVDAFIVMFEDVLFLFNSEKDTHSHVTEFGYKMSPHPRLTHSRDVIAGCKVGSPLKWLNDSGGSTLFRHASLLKSTATFAAKKTHSTHDPTYSPSLHAPM